MQCGFCSELIEGIPSSTLLCNHNVHTECLIRRFCICTVQDVLCPTCNTFVAPEHLQEEGYSVNSSEGRNTVIRNMWGTDAAFKRDIQAIRESRITLGKKTKALFALQKTIKGTLDQEIEALIEPIQEKVRAAKSAFKASTEYKEDKKARSSLTTKLHSLRMKWGSSFYSVKKALKNIVSLGPNIGYCGRRLRNFDVTIK